MSRTAGARSTLTSGSTSPWTGMCSSSMCRAVSGLQPTSIRSCHWLNFFPPPLYYGMGSLESKGQSNHDCWYLTSRNQRFANNIYLQDKAFYRQIFQKTKGIGFAGKMSFFQNFPLILGKFLDF